MNIFPYSSDNKRYHTYNYYLREKYGGKTVKIPLNASIPCPHAESGGCVYCGEYINSWENFASADELKRQFEEKKKIIGNKWRAENYIVYFQSGTNTNAPVSVLRGLFYGALGFPKVAGIDIATRPDCIGEDTLDLLRELSEKTNLTVELGLQTSNDATALRINRGYDLSVFSYTYKRLADSGISVCVHIINSLPGETREDMLDTARYLAGLVPYGVKIHMLGVVKNTTLAKEYEDNPIKLLDMDEYIDIIISQLEILPPETVILRLTGDPDRNELVAPMWLTKKIDVLNGVDKKMAAENRYQGGKYTR